MNRAMPCETLPSSPSITSMRIQRQFVHMTTLGFRLAMLGILIAGCTSKEPPVSEQRDSATLQQVAVAKKHPGKNANGDGRWRDCTESSAPAPFKLSIDKGKLTAGETEIDALEAAAYAECFMQGLDDATVGASRHQHEQLEFVQPATTIGLRLQPASFAMAMRFDSTLAPGHGYIAGMFRHLYGGPFRTDNRIIVHVAGASLLWMGKDVSGNPTYAVLVLKNYPERNGLATNKRVSLVASGAMKEKPSTTRRTVSYARFEDPGPHAGNMVPDGSWIGCDAGCCVAGALTAFMPSANRRYIPQDSLLTEP